MKKIILIFVGLFLLNNQVLGMYGLNGLKRLNDFLNVNFEYEIKRIGRKNGNVISEVEICFSTATETIIEKFKELLTNATKKKAKKKNLIKLDLRYAHITKKVVEEVSKHKNLIIGLVLDFYDYRVDEEIFKLISEFPKLESLELRSCKLENSHLKFLSKLRKLKKLNLSNCKGLTCDYLCKLSSKTIITNLNLENCESKKRRDIERKQICITEQICIKKHLSKILNAFPKLTKLRISHYYKPEIKPTVKLNKDQLYAFRQRKLTVTLNKKQLNTLRRGKKAIVPFSDTHFQITPKGVVFNCPLKNLSKLMLE